MHADFRLNIRPLLWALMVFVATTLAMAPLVHAQPVSAKKRWTARKLGGEGMDLFRAGDYQAALEKFSAADELVPAPTLKLRIARCLGQLDRMMEAAATYRAVIETELDQRAPAVHHAARTDAVPELAELRKAIPTVMVIVEGPGAEAASATLDGESYPAELLGKKHSLDPGTYTFEAERVEDGATTREQIVLQRGDAIDVTLTLPTEEGPGEVRRPRRGPQRDDGAAWRTAGWISVGVGGAALSVGSLVGVVVLGEQSSLEERCPDRQCPPEAHDDAEQFDTLRTVSTVGFIVGGVGVAAGVTLLLLAPDDGDGAAPGDDEPDELGLDSAELGLCSGAPGLCLRGTF